MSKVFNYNGKDDFFSRGSLYGSRREGNPFLSLGHQVDVYFPPCKRSRVTAPFILSEDRCDEKKQISIEVLPDECLFEIFRRLSGDQEKFSCASVSKRWLMLVSQIHKDEYHSAVTQSKAVESAEKDGSGCNKVTSDVDGKKVEGDGYLTRCLEGKKATDIRLAAIAVGTVSRGGLGKLKIRGKNSSGGVTNLGLKAVARGCPSLRDLSLWNVSSISDDGLIEIANGCHLLERLDLCQCPGITDKALVAIAKSCPSLSSVALDSCWGIGNEGLKAIGQCSNLKSISIRNCTLVGDQGIASLFSSASHVLTKVKLQALKITDVSLAVVGHYGLAVTDLVLTSLHNVNEKGFWVMGSGRGLQKLNTFTVTSCQGVTDSGLDAIGKGCPKLKHLCIRKCAFLSDIGLASFTKAARALESLQLEECHRVSQFGIIAAIVNCDTKLEALSLVNCLGFKDGNLVGLPVSPCKSLKSLSIQSCPGFGNASLAMLGKLCPELENLKLSGLLGITDAGLLPLLESCEFGLTNVNLSGCVNLTDAAVSSLVKLHCMTLETLHLDGVKGVSDASLASIAENCCLLSDLDVSGSAITDNGIAILASADQLMLQVLSVSGCSVSDKSLPYIVKMGQTLMGLNIQQCRGISSNKVDMLIEQLWRCDILP